MNEEPSMSGDPEIDKLLNEVSTSITEKEETIVEKTSVEPTEASKKPAPSQPLGEIDKILGTSVFDKTKVEAKVEPLKTVEPQKVPEVTTEEIEDKKQGRPERDLTGFNEQQAKFLRRMPYDGYQYFSKLVKESEGHKTALAARDKELAEARTKVSGEAPKSYYENPEAFSLLPKVKSVVAEVTKFDAVVKHWENQLTKIDSGEDWEDLSQDPKTGEIYVSRKLEASTEARKEITRKLAQAMSIVDNGTRQYHQLAEEHKKSSETYVAKISQLESTYLPLFADKEKAPAKLANGVQAKLKEAGLEDNPYLGMLSKSIALNLLLKHQISAYLKTASSTSPIVETRAAGPSGKELSGNREATKSNDQPKILGFNEINKVLGNL